MNPGSIKSSGGGGGTRNADLARQEMETCTSSLTRPHLGLKAASQHAQRKGSDEGGAALMKTPPMVVCDIGMSGTEAGPVGGAQVRRGLDGGCGTNSFAGVDFTRLLLMEMSLY